MFKFNYCVTCFLLFFVFSFTINAQFSSTVFKQIPVDSVTEKAGRIKSINILIQSPLGKTGNIEGILKERQKLLQSVLASPLKNIQELLLSKNIISTVSDSLKSLVEKETAEIRGTVCAMEFDYNEGEPKREYFLMNSSGMYLLRGLADNPLFMRSNDSIVVKNCIQLQNLILYDNSEVTTIKSTTAVDPNIRDIKVLVLLSNFSDPSKTELFTTDKFMSILHNPNSSIQKWFAECSSGRARIADVAVVNWTNINSTWSNYSETDDEYRKKITGTGIDAAKYDFVVEIVNSKSFYQYAGMSFVGSILTGWTNTRLRFCWINYDGFTADKINSFQTIQPYSKTIIHELGHAFGFGHSSTYSITNDVFSVVSAYGDEFCMMGSSLSGHYKGYFKESIGWLDASDILNITASGSYTMKNFETKTGVRLAKVNVGNLTQPAVVYLEYRNATLYDSVYINKTGMPYTRGLLLSTNYNYFGNYVGPAPLRLDEGPEFGQSFIIDTKSTFGSKTTPILSGAATYTDAVKGIRIGPVQSVTDSTITFTVTYLQNVIVPPVLLAPGNNMPAQMTSPNTLYFKWSNVAVAKSYQIQFSHQEDNFNTPLYSTQSTLNEVYVTTANLQSQTFGIRWRVRAVDSTGTKSDWSIPFQFIFTTTSNSKEDGIPTVYALSQNYPNPFNPVTTIKYSIPSVETLHAASQQWVTLKIYDLLGREIAALVNEYKSPGVYNAVFNGSRLAGGVYFYCLTAGEFIQTKKLILLK